MWLNEQPQMSHWTAAPAAALDRDGGDGFAWDLSLGFGRLTAFREVLLLSGRSAYAKSGSNLMSVDSTFVVDVVDVRPLSFLTNR